MKRIAIIPARSGSKGLPDKNILPLAGKPMLAYSIEAALQSGLFDSVMVSTDSGQYAQIALEYGAEVPFLRTAENSTDTASSWDAVREVLGRLAEDGRQFDTVTLLQPTSPLRDAGDICGAMKLYQERNAKTVVSVCEVQHPVEWTFALGAMCSLEKYASSPYRNMRRQDIPKKYMENGAVFITDIEKLFMPDHDLYFPECYAYIMGKEHSYDIDDEIDLINAETLIKIKKERGLL